MGIPVKDNRFKDSEDNRPKVKDNRVKDNQGQGQPSQEESGTTDGTNLHVSAYGMLGFGMYRMETCQTAAEQCRTKLRWSSAMYQMGA